MYKPDQTAIFEGIQADVLALRNPAGAPAPLAVVLPILGSPEGVEDGSFGDIRISVDTGQLWVKQSGSGSSGWSQIAVPGVSNVGLFNILDYGAESVDGSGEFDSSDAIEEASYAAAENGGGKGGIVLIPPGDYEVTRRMPLLAGVTYKGYGPQSSRIFGNFGDTIFAPLNTNYDEDLSGRTLNVFMRDLHIDGLDDAQTPIAVDFSQITRGAMENCTVRRAALGVRNDNYAFYNKFRNLEVADCPQCLTWRNGANENTLLGGRLLTSTTAILIAGGPQRGTTHNMVINSAIEGFSVAGISLEENINGMTGNNIIGNRFEGPIPATATAISIPHASVQETFIVGNYMANLLVGISNNGTRTTYFSNPTATTVTTPVSDSQPLNSFVVNAAAFRYIRMLQEGGGATGRLRYAGTTNGWQARNDANTGFESIGGSNVRVWNGNLIMQTAGPTARIQWAANGNAIDTKGTGSPEGVVTATPGSTYCNISGGANTTFYVKESGSGNTGWIAK